MLFADTIAAVSTAPGVGALAVVRLSGPLACQIIERLFDPKGTQTREIWLKANKATLGYIKDGLRGELIDEVMVTPFLAPNSFTGEDLIEVSCHGSPMVTQKILSMYVEHGARLAAPGEFTQRAFLHGKIDLTQAEAVLDLIQAKTTTQGKLALSALSGDLGRQIKKVRQSLMQLLTTITAGIDFPEEVGETPEQDIETIISQSSLCLKRLADTARFGKFLREGLRLSIVGKPNVGKSSLLNQLLKFERAIVTDIPGTTRDVLQESLDINGIPVTLVDTAGIRHTKDAVEVIGIARTKQAIEDSHLVLLVFDVTQGWSQEENHIIELIDKKPFILLQNKVDLCPANDSQPYTDNRKTPPPVAQLLISAKTGDGMDALCQAIEHWALDGLNIFDCGPSLNERQGALCQRALIGLAHVKQTLTNGMPQDCLASDLKITIDCLSEICGEMVSEEVISEVFANFCIGK